MKHELWMMSVMTVAMLGGLTMNSSASAATTLNLTPTDDVIVAWHWKYGTRGGTGQNNSVINHSHHEVTYIKFDVSAFASIDSAVLRMYEVSTSWTDPNDPTDRIDLYHTVHDNWTELTQGSGQSWLNNNFPAADGPRIDRFEYSGPVNVWHTWDLSGFDFDTHAADGTLSFFLENTLGGGWNHTAYASKDNDNATLHPYLEVTGELADPIPAPGALAGLMVALACHSTLRKRKV